MTRSRFIIPIVAVACFVGGWLARGDRSPQADYGRLTPTDAPCAVRGRPVHDVPALAAEAGLFNEPSEGRSTVDFRRTGGTARLWVAQGPVDDEIHVAAATYQLEWREHTGWVVNDCRYLLDRGR